ncbi:ATP-binding protein [Jejudonia soesokkakensis]|uniref:histidine kinase n=1 Tax=Jejudonia soesokkakensis TaxID=1323432 RepID=A0ABW2MSA8_9FLAO
MNLTKKTETEVLKVYNTWLHSYLNGDVATYNKYLDKDYHFIGSTANEEFLNKKDTTTFFENTADQLAGKCDLRNETKIVEKFKELVFVTHLFDAWFLNGKEYNFYGRFRFSNALKKNKEGWRFIYQHYSTPDAKAEEGESIGFEKISAENLQLREAISRRTKELEEKNRELEVEGALERIRAQAVAMKESTDLLDIVVTMRNEFTKLGHEAHYFWHMMWQSKTYEKAMTSGDGTKIGFVMQLPRHIHGDIPQLAKWEKSKKPTVVFAMDVEEAIDYVNKMVSLGDFKNIDPQAPTENDIRHIGGLTFIMARTTHGEIGYSLPGVVKSPPKEDIDILVKFAGAFDLAHRRFLDLQKAEKQARETQIELSLERIRSRVTAMQESSDLFDVVVSMRNEFLSLGHQADYFWHMKWTKDTYEMSMTASDGNRLGMIITVPKFVHEQIEELHTWEESNSPYFVLALNGKDAWDYIEKMNTYGKYKLVDPHAPTEEDILHIGGLTFIIARTTHGEIGFSIAGKVDNPPKASIEILVRFASVFDLAYKRFEDLKKAEAQTRETQIELALEKVRSRTMAMQHSDELSEAAELLYHEFYKLGISPFSCGYLINDDTENQWNVWMTDANEESFKNFWTLPFDADHHIKERYESWQKMKPFHSTELKGDTNIEHHKIIAQYAPWKKSSLENLPDCLVLSSANFKYGHLLIVTGEVLSGEMQSILIRFAKVFEQTYIRFLDLEKAEIQTRETQVQLALEKVRSRTMAMQHSDELIETSELLFEQIKDLGIEVWSCGYSLWYDDDTYFIGYNPMPDGKMGPKFKIPLTEDIFFKTIRKAKRKGDEFLIFESKGKSLANTYKYMDTLPVVGEGMRAIVNMGYELPKFQVTHCGFFSHGHLMFITHQHYPEAHSIFKRFTKEFEQTYTRFLDLQKAEAQAREAQIEIAVERVRAEAMAMHATTDFEKVTQELLKQVQNLELDGFTGASILSIDENDVFTWWDFSSPGNISDPKSQLIKYDAHKYQLLGKEVLNKWKEGKNYMVFQYDLERLHIAVKEWEEINPAIAKEFKKAITEGNFTHQWNPCGRLANGLLAFDMIHPPNEDVKNITIKMTHAFEQAYIRFQDLKKAEAQVREAQIEAALEKVRSRSLAMHNANELTEVVVVIVEKLKELDVILDANGVTLCTYFPDSKNVLHWIASPDFKHVGKYLLPYFDHVIFDDAWKSKEQGDAYFSKAYSVEDKNSFFKHAFKHSDYKHFPQEIKKFILNNDKHTLSFAWQKNSAILIPSNTGVLPTEEEKEILMRFSNVFEQAYIRFMDLKKAEAQAREAQIEAALEKVRSRTMAMQHSNELPEAANVLFTEIQKLGIPAWSCGYNILSEDKTSSTCIMSSEGEIQSPFVLPLTEHKSLKPWHEAIINNEEFFVYEQGGDDLKEHYQYMQSLPELQETFKQLRNADIALPSFQVNHLAKFTNGFLLFITYERIPEAHDIFQRFARVFEQTYTRFLDLQKAETQVRKAQIEAALERTRTQSMLMQRSEELDATSKVFHEQLKLLGIDTEFSYVWLPDETQDEHQFWVAWNTEEKGSTLIQSKAIVYPLDKLEPYTAKCFKDWESGVPVHIHHIKPKEVTLFFSAWEELLKDAKKLTPKYFSDGLYYAEAFMKYGCFGINIKRAITEEESQILQRFSIEFERTYTRFLDLQKAEAQTREAQINLAVERVRAKALAMHKSEEIMEVVAKLKEEVMSLDIPDVIAATIFLNEGEDKVRMWDLSTLEKSNDVYQIPFDITFKLKKKDPHLYVKRVWENPEDYFLEVQNTKDFKRIIAWLRENDKQDVAIEVEEFIKSVKLERLHHAVKKLNNGKLVIDLLHPPSDEMETILTKMGAAFDLAYKRFEDLQRAEAQTKEARVEIALEKVRTVALGLETSEDMLQVAQVLYEQLLELGFSNIRNTIIDINNDEDETFLDYDYSHEMGGTVTLMTYSDDPVLEKQVKIIASSTEKFSETILEGKTLQNLIDMRKKNGEADDPRLFNADAVSYNLYAFGNGAIGISNFGRLKEREKELLNRFRNVFTFAYQRFSDLQAKEKQSQKLKTEKLRLEETLSHLQATQKQLIQSEKMASLGELTAGIAHEIQNPLNFVNNFSEVSNELIDEIDDEIANGDMEEVKAILSDIKQNLEKINHHGKRADAIVKGMLQHSRKSTAEKVPTNINKLADEYLRLAYHGLRAKDKSFNATLETEFDESIGMVKVIPQDMGRVILNLITNAFYATNEQKNVTEDNNFKPTVSVSTKKQNDRVTISVKDNGNGIPKAVVDKIFQPFFTTKPTGEGTGLGLSMSYDIVTKGHGGELNVTTKKGEGTTFIISIPNIP